MNEQNELSQILALLNKLDTDVRTTNEKLEKEIEENKKKFEKWDERYFNLVKEQGSTARTIIIAAASVVVLSPVLGAVADLVKNHLNW
jgi:MerR family transcriptional regulator, repressor of the yfmOP operon